MRVAVGPFAKHAVHRAKGDVVVPVDGLLRRRALEERRDIGEQQRLMLVDDNRGRRVKRLDIDEARFDGCGHNDRLELVRDVDELGRVLGYRCESSCRNTDAA